MKVVETNITEYLSVGAVVLEQGRSTDFFQVYTGQECALLVFWSSAEVVSC